MEPNCGLNIVFVLSLEKISNSEIIQHRQALKNGLCSAAGKHLLAKNKKETSQSKQYSKNVKIFPH